MAVDFSRKPPGFNTVTGKAKYEAMAAKLLERAESVAGYLLPMGRKDGNEWVVGSIDGEKGKSLKVNLKKGVWSDFAGQPGGSDLLALWAEKRGVKMHVALDEAAEWLGIGKPKTAPWDKPKVIKSAEVDQPKVIEKDSEDKWWLKVEPIKYDYFDADGELWVTVRRWDNPDQAHPEPKRVRPWHHKTESEKWPEGPRPLYNIPQIVKTAGPIVLVEGEKCANHLKHVGYVATTMAGGSSQAKTTDWSPLRGRDVIRWADNDAAGVKWAIETRAELERAGVKSIRDVVIPAGVEEGWDCADTTFGDAERLIAGAGAPTQAPPIIASRDLSLRPLSSIPKRRFVYGHVYQRGKITITAGAGGSGKSALHVVEALAIATGRDLLETGQPIERCRVWLIVLEDDEDELHRRVGAALMHFNVDPSEIKGRIRITVAEEAPLFKIAMSDRNGTQVSAEAVAAVKADIISNDIGWWSVDPYVYAHDTNENDNSAQSLVMNAFADIARSTNSACALVHHAKKPNAADKDGPSSGDIRGASALVNSARHGRIVNTMSASEAAKMDVNDDARFFYFRASSVKANYSPPGGRSGNWYKLHSVRLPNGEGDDDGDGVGVVTKWTPPDPMKSAGVTVDTLRAVQNELERSLGTGNPYLNDPKAKKYPWIGNCIAEITKLPITDNKDKLNGFVKVWLKSGALRTEVWADPESGQPRTIIRRGNPV